MQRYFAKEKRNEEFILYETDIHHIKNVMRYTVGDEIEVVYDNTIYICSITTLVPLSLKIMAEKKQNTEMPINLTIAVSLVNEQKMDLILQKLTELGVSTIIPIKTERSIVKITDNKIEKKLTRWQMICKEASEQSKRNKIPKIEKIMTLKELSKIDIPNKYICSLNDKTKPLKYYLNKNISEILFAIGPEGGFSEKEESFLLDSKFIPVSLGKRVMRVETATFYVASIINYVCDD